MATRSGDYLSCICNVSFSFTNTMQHISSNSSESNGPQCGAAYLVNQLPPLEDPVTTVPRSLTEFIATSIHSDARWAIADFTTMDDSTAIAAALTLGSCLVAVSDGSFKNEFGTASWIIQVGGATGGGDIGEFLGSCITPGLPSDQSTYCSELTRIFGIITIIDVVCQYHGIGMGQIEMACDGLLALDQASIDSDIVNPKYPQFDLVLTICKAICWSPLIWSFCHIKGHQDDWDVELNHWEWLNVQMDADTKRYWAAQVDHDWSVQQRVRGEPWSLWQGYHKICNDVWKAVHAGIHHPWCLQYWIKLG